MPAKTIFFLLFKNYSSDTSAFSAHCALCSAHL